MKSRLLRNIVILLYGLIVASGPVCLAYATATHPLPHSILWLIPPLAALIYADVYIAIKPLYSYFIDKGRYVSFFLCTWALAYLVDLTAVYMQYLFREWMHLPQEIQNPASPLIFIYTAISSILMVLTITGFLIWRFFDDYRHRDHLEQAYKMQIETRRRALCENINMSEIRNKLKEIIAEIGIDPALAATHIRKLSEFLRHKLYENPDLHADTNLSGIRNAMHQGYYPSYLNFIIKKKYRIHRHVALIAVLACVSVGVIFEAPDSPVFDHYCISYAIFFFIITTALIYLNLYLIYPIAKRRRASRRYAYLLAAILLLIFIGMNVMTISFGNLTNIHKVEMPLFLIPFGIAGNMLSFLLLFAGTITLSMLKTNILGTWRLDRLEAEMASVEFEVLQQQISPHTLFNLLNNIGFLIYDDPEKAATVLKSFENFLEYLLSRNSLCATTVREEMEFIRNFLVMEESTGRKLDISVECQEDMMEFTMPPLILLPYVENAVKHSIKAADHRFIRIKLCRDGSRLMFSCANPYSPESIGSGRTPKKSGGIGIENTWHRLRFIYGEEFRHEVHTSESIYKIILKLPAYEMHNN